MSAHAMLPISDKVVAPAPIAYLLCVHIGDTFGRCGRGVLLLEALSVERPQTGCASNKFLWNEDGIESLVNIHLPPSMGFC